MNLKNDIPIESLDRKILKAKRKSIKVNMKGRKYFIGPLDNGFWLENELGEGRTVSASLLFEVLNETFKCNKF